MVVAGRMSSGGWICDTDYCRVAVWLMSGPGQQAGGTNYKKVVACMFQNHIFHFLLLDINMTKW